MNNVIAAVVKGGRSAGEAAAISAQPWLGSVFFKWFLDIGLNWICSFTDHNAEVFATNLIIDVQTKHENSQVYLTLAAIVAQKGSVDEKTIQKAKDAWRHAINWDGTASTNIT